MGAATRSTTADGVDALAGIARPDADLGDQLLAAARAIASSHHLASVLADPGVPAEQRVGLVRRVFGANVGPQAQTVLTALVSGRWSRTDDLVGGIEELGFRALAVQKGSERLGAELFTVARAVSSDGRLELALGGQGSPVAARLAIVDSLLGSATPATRSIVRHVVQLPRGRKPFEAVERAQAIVAEARDSLVATVQVAKALTPEQAAVLSARLESGYGRKIAINQVVEPALVGGVRITVGDDVIDGTVRSRLDDLRLRLAG